MKHEPINFDNARIFGIDTNYPFLRLQDGTFIELAFGVRYETDFPKDFELSAECSEFILDHFEGIRKGLTKFKVDQTSELRIIKPEIESRYGYDCGEIQYTYNGIEFVCKSREFVPEKHLIDWIEQNHEPQYSEICRDGIEWFIRKKDITISEIESPQDELDELFTCEKCNHTLSVSYSLKDPRYCFLCDESIPTSELLK